MTKDADSDAALRTGELLFDPSGPGFDAGKPVLSPTVVRKGGNDVEDGVGDGGLVGDAGMANPAFLSLETVAHEEGLVRSLDALGGEDPSAKGGEAGLNAGSFLDGPGSGEDVLADKRVFDSGRSGVGSIRDRGGA